MLTYYSSLRQNCSLRIDVHHSFVRINLCGVQKCVHCSPHTHMQDQHIWWCVAKKKLVLHNPARESNEEGAPLLFLDLKTMSLSFMNRKLHLSYTIQTLTNAHEMYVFYSCMCCMYTLFISFPILRHV